MVTNEHWGKPNESRAPWSLWKMNSLLGRKPVVAGWKAKSIPPFRPSYELIIDLVLPANILDCFRIQCPFRTVEEWVDSIRRPDDVHEVAIKVLREHFSARRVARLRR